MGSLLLAVAIGASAALAGCQSSSNDISSNSATQTDGEPMLRITLDVEEPVKSMGVLQTPSSNHAFNVGYGKYGIACEGSTFTEGVTPIGRFRVNAILTDDNFAMDPELIEQSGKSEEFLKTTLFSNMSSIDFKGDGETGEYGSGYISLAPVPETPQPFEFNEYAGTFRWYSFAIHGTNNDIRVGRKVTGGCLNVKASDLEVLLDSVELGDLVEITANGPCQPG